LVIGGSGFPCTNIVKELWERGHNIGIFNRGNNNSKWYRYRPVIHPIIGDRNTDDGLFALEHHIWLRNQSRRCPYDAVIDCGNALNPTSIQNMINAIGCDIKHYVFISSSVVNYSQEDTDLEYLKYRNDKEECENIVRYFYSTDMDKDNKYLIARPSFLCGDGDTTNRFDYNDFPNKVLWKHNGNLLKRWNHVDLWTKGLIDEIENESIGIWEQKYYDE
jgi:nucleoside-diphosphate-sugar epimerase